MPQWLRTHPSASMAETQLNGRELNSQPQWQKLICLPAWSNLKSLTSQHHRRTPTSKLRSRTSINSFSKSSKFCPHLLWAWRHQHSSPFPVWGLLWQWWLWYPLRTSVNCTNWLHTWTLNPNSSKPNQTEW